MKCLVCGTELICKYYRKKGYGYTSAKEKAVYECPSCGHNERIARIVMLKDGLILLFLLFQ